MAAAAINFKEGAGNTLIRGRTPVLAVNGMDTQPGLGSGVAGSAADNTPKVDVSANATATGFVSGLRGVGPATTIATVSAE